MKYDYKKNYCQNNSFYILKNINIWYTCFVFIIGGQMKEVKKSDLNNNKLSRWEKFCFFSMIVILAGIIGWIYEFVFYYFNGNMTQFYMQGGNFLPWINIYAIGAIMIVLLTYKIKKYPLLVFFVSFISTGILEYFSGLLIYKIFDGARYWNYNTEILNFGNIDGFVCLRSVLSFGLSALLLMYIILPFCINLIKKANKKKILIICIVLLSIILIDELYNLVICKIFDLPSAIDFYRSLGFQYVK